MAKRFGRTIINRPHSDRLTYEGRIVGADYAPFAGNCQNPRSIAFTGLRDKALSRLSQWKAGHTDHAEGYGPIGSFPDRERVQHVDVDVRCRQCPNCLKARAAHWRFRAKKEIQSSERTWFGTLTLRPEEQFRLEAKARARLYAGGTRWAQLSEREAFSEICREITGEFQRFMKRIRKTHAGLRFMAVYEHHKSGLPHMHCLIHETRGPIRHAQLQAQWLLGFSKWNLVPDDEHSKAAHYVCKYLTKSISHRLLSSKRYGKE